MYFLSDLGHTGTSILWVGYVHLHPISSILVATRKDLGLGLCLGIVHAGRAVVIWITRGVKNCGCQWRVGILILILILLVQSVLIRQLEHKIT